MVNFFLKGFLQLPQLEQATRLQNRRWFRQAGIGRRQGLIGPLAPQSDTTVAFIEKREHLLACDATHFQDQETLAAERMKRVGYGGPSPRRFGAWCSLLGVSLA